MDATNPDSDYWMSLPAVMPFATALSVASLVVGAVDTVALISSTSLVNPLALALTVIWLVALVGVVAYLRRRRWGVVLFSAAAVLQLVVHLLAQIGPNATDALALGGAVFMVLTLRARWLP